MVTQAGSWQMTTDDWKKFAEAESAVMASLKRVYSEYAARRPGGEKHPMIVAYETAQARLTVFNALAQSETRASFSLVEAQPQETIALAR